MSSSENKSRMRQSSERLSVLLAANLMERLGHGSTLYRTTWKAHTTPSGRSLLRARSVGRPISETDCTGWPTPVARDHMPAHSPEYIAEKVAQGHGMANLNDRAQLTGWTTPAARDWKDSAADISTRSDTGRERFDQLPRQAVLTGWPTPTAKLAAGGEYSDPELALARVQGPHANDLRNFAKLTDGALTGWNTPSVDNFRSRSGNRKDEMGNDQLVRTLPMAPGGPARLTAHGTLLTGSGAGTVSGGQLNPDLSRWLMGLPEEWARSMPGWQDWQMWQVLTALVLSEPKPTG